MSDVTITLQIQRADAEQIQRYYRDGWLDMPGPDTPRGRTDAAIIAALSPTEPTKRGAVVTVGNRLFCRGGGSSGWGSWRWYEFDYDSGAYSWREICAIGTPVVHFEGISE